MQQKPLRGKPKPQQSKEKEKHAINERISALQVRLIGANGEQLGVLITREALRLAEDAGLDLVEVAPEASPPVCKIIDYGKLKYREQKKAAESRKRGATQSVKELRVRYNTDKHDLETKIRNARKFIEEGDKVRFQMRFKGREAVYRDLGEEIFKHIGEMLIDIASLEEHTPLIGQKMTVTFGPKAQAKTVQK
jgi:translation initiation factor IF-3